MFKALGVIFALILASALLALVVTILQSLPDIQRYLKIRSM